MSQRTNKTTPLEHGIKFGTGVFVFFICIGFGTYFLQSSLIILQNYGLYAHWASILIVLPALSGLIQHVIQSPARLPLSFLGAILSASMLYPFYSEKFWATAPSFTDTVVFVFATTGFPF